MISRYPTPSIELDVIRDTEYIERQFAQAANDDTAAFAHRIIRCADLATPESSAEIREAAIRAYLRASAHLFRVEGNVQNALRSSAAARALSKGMSDQLRSEVLLRHGRLSVLRLDFPEALACVSAVLDIAAHNNDAPLRARCLVEYGLLLSQAGLPRQANRLFDRALAVENGGIPAGLMFSMWSIRTKVTNCADVTELNALRTASDQTIIAARDVDVAQRNYGLCVALLTRSLLELVNRQKNSAALYKQEADKIKDVGRVADLIRDAATSLHDFSVEQKPESMESFRATLQELEVISSTLTAWLLEIFAELVSKCGSEESWFATMLRIAQSRVNAFQRWTDSVKTERAEESQLQTNAPSHNRTIADSTTRAAFERMAVTAELRDDTTGKHCYRVGYLAARIAERAGLPAQEVRDIGFAGRMHDIGKIAIPDSILLKKGKLTEVEMRFMQRHTTIGAEIISKLDDPAQDYAYQVALYHHERWDGNGYPRGLIGEQIPLAARIVAIADVFDALLHVRPYKSAWPLERVVDFISSQSGAHFEPQLVEIFLHIMKDAVKNWDAFYAALEADAADTPYVRAQAVIERLLT